MMEKGKIMKKVLVLGASGLFGGRAAEAFAAAGWQVTRFKRGGDMKAAAMGMDVIVNGLNPPMYHNWAELVPAITAEVIAAGLASGARVIVPGNVYVYGTQPAPWGPDTPHRPVSRKGAIRAAMENSYRNAARAQGLRVLILRGGDFLDARAESTMFNQLMLRSFAAGKITVGGAADAMHAWAPLQDMARAAVALADHPNLPDFADVPFAGLSFTPNDLKAELERQTGRRLRFARFPWWAMRLAAPFWELARELGEMRYLYDAPHWLNPKPLQSLLPGFQGTSLVDVVAETLAAKGVAARTTGYSASVPVAD